jgi:hypothetical protein
MEVNVEGGVWRGWSDEIDLPVSAAALALAAAFAFGAGLVLGAALALGAAFAAVRLAAVLALAAFGAAGFLVTLTAAAFEDALLAGAASTTMAAATLRPDWRMGAIAMRCRVQGVGRKEVVVVGGVGVL